MSDKQKTTSAPTTKQGSLMKENPQSRQAEDSNKGASSEISRKTKPTTQVPTSPEARAEQGYDVVTEVNRDLPADSPEQARKKNNASRDARTNLGRTIPSTVVSK